MLYRTQALRLEAPTLFRRLQVPSRSVLCSAAIYQTRKASSVPSQLPKMKAARVTAWGKSPKYITIPDIQPPSSGELQLKVLAVGIPRVVRGRALGRHYSVTQEPLPFDPSVDGVGVDEATGDMYFIPPFSGPLLAEKANVPREKLIKIPATADPVALAGLINPASSSWMALQHRVKGGCQGRNVFILGATSASGSFAAKAARQLGAAKVIGASRTLETLEAVEGLDERVILGDPSSVPKSSGPVHIVLDFVGGKEAIRVLESAEIERGTDLQYVHVGGLSNELDFAVPWDLLRSRPISIVGSGKGSWGMSQVMKELPALVPAICSMGRPDYIVGAPMAEVGSVWDSEDLAGKRLVLIP